MRGGWSNFCEIAPQMKFTGPYWWWINIGLYNGLVPSVDGTKPLPEPMLTKIYVAICRHYSISQEICTRFLLCCGHTLTDFPISIRLTSLALWQSNDCPSASKATLMNMDKYFMWIHYERLHNHNKAKHNKTVCIFLGVYCSHQCVKPLKQNKT